MSRRNARRPLHLRKLARGLFLRELDAPLDIANGLEILAELGAIARAHLSRQARHIPAQEVQDAALLLNLAKPHCRIGAGILADQALERRARVSLHRERR